MSENLAAETSAGFKVSGLKMSDWRGNQLYVAVSLESPGDRGMAGLERLFGTTSHTSLVVVSNPEASARGVTLRTFCKHIPYTCSQIRDPRWSRRKGSQRAQLVPVTHGTDGLPETKDQEGKGPLQGHTVAHGAARINTWRGSMAGLSRSEPQWP